MAKKKKSRVTGWKAPFKIGGVTFSVPGKTQAAAKRNRARFIKKHLKNVRKTQEYRVSLTHPHGTTYEYTVEATGKREAAKAAKSLAAGRTGTPAKRWRTQVAMLLSAWDSRPKYGQ